MSRPYILPIRDCAQILGMTPDALRARGYNHVERGKYDIAAIVEAELNEAKSKSAKKQIEDEQILLLRERRTKIASQNAERQAILIHIDDASTVCTEHIMSAKKKLMTIGVSVSQRIAGETQPKKIAELITAEVKTALEELSFDARENFTSAALRRIGSRMGAAAESDSESVGRRKARPKRRVRNGAGKV